MWRKFFERLIEPRSLINLVVLFVALLGIFGVPQQALSMTDQQVMIALLIFIIAEQITVNILYLASIDEKLDKVRIAVSGLDTLFSRRRESKTVQALIERASWMRVSGVTLDNFIGNFGKIIEERAEAGAKFEFILSDENAKFLDELSPSNFYVGAKYRADIGNAVNNFQGLSQAAKQRIQLKKSPKVSFCSVIQARLDDGSEYMAVEHYLYKIEGGAARSFEMDRITSPAVFAYYEAAENKRWADAISVSL